MPRIGIYAPWASGDAILSTMALKYKGHFWPGHCHLVWFVLPEKRHSHAASADIVAHQPLVDEVRIASEPSSEVIKLRVGHRTNSQGHPLSVKKPAGLMAETHKRMKSFADLHYCYFPAPWANCDRLQGLFALASNAVFDYPEPPHPCLEYSPEEDESASRFVASLPHARSVMLETRCGSNQSNWTNETTKVVMDACRRELGPCNFIFASPGSSQGHQADCVAECGGFTIRQCIPIYNRCDLFVSTSSAVAIATCSWSASPGVKRVDYTNNPLITTRPIARGQTRWTNDQNAIPSLIKEVLATS